MPTAVSTSTTTPNSVHKSLPEVSVLFNDTVALFKKTALPFLILALIQTVISAAVLVVVAILGIAVGAGTGLANLSTLTSMDSTQMAALIPSFVAGFGVFFVALIGIFLFVGPAFQASLLLLIAKYEGKGDYGTILKEGFKYIVPMLLASLITGFLVFGGFFLFFIPGIVISFLAAFTFNEIVLEGKKPLAALYNSVNLVSQHFWGILGRCLLLGLVNFGIFAVVGIVQGILQSTVGEGSAVLLNIIFNIAMMPLGMVFNVVLYRQVKAASVEKETKPTWIWVVAIVGWILALLLGMTMGRAAIDAIRDAENQSMAEEGEMDWSQMMADENLTGMDEGQVELAASTFTAINDYREDNNLEPLADNPILCYFANVEDDDLEIPGLFQHMYSLTGTETSEEIVNDWIASEVVANPPADEAITNPDVTQACVTVSEDNLIMVASTDTE